MSTTKKQKSEYVIQTVINALRLLEEFRDDAELGVTQISKRLDLHKNNVFRLLATLEERDYIEQSPTERYRLGVRCLEVGQAYVRSHTLLDRAGPILRRLAQQARETAHLAQLQGFEVAHLDGAVFEQAILHPVRTGMRLPIHCTALGKVLLGCASSSVLGGFDAYLTAGGELEPRTPSTIVDRHKLFEHVRTVAHQGFAVDEGEFEAGLSCAAAPVFDRDGHVVAALSVSGPSFRLDTERLHRDLVQLVVDAAEQLSREIGYPQRGH